MRPERGGSSGVAAKLMAPPPSLWRTPTPYVFLSLAFMMGVIAVALLVLICTRRKAASPSLTDDEQKAAAAAAARALVPLDREPKVVFMPGDDDRAPSFLARVKPLGGAGGDAAAAV